MNLSDRVRYNIRFFLEAQGKTYGEIGFHRTYVSDVIHGRRHPSPSRIDEFAARLKVDVSELCRMPEEER